MENEKKRGKGLWIIVIIMAILALLFALVEFFTDFLWFKELDYVSVFLTKLFTQIKIGIPVFIVVGFLAYIILKLIKKRYFKKVESLDAPDEGTINILSWVLAALYGGIASYFCITHLWFEWLQFKNSSDFSLKDPLFDNDISLYIFQLPFIKEVCWILIALAVAFIALTVIYYMLLMTMRKPTIFEEDDDEEPYEPYEYETSKEDEDRFTGFDRFGETGRAFGDFFGGAAKDSPFGKKNRQQPKKQFDSDNFHELLSIAAKELIIAGVIFFLMLGATFFLKQYDLLSVHTGAVYGAGFTDVNITLWMFRILAGLSVVAAIMFVLGISGKSIKKMIVVPVVMVLIAALGVGGQLIVQNYVVSPDELNKESKYLERNIEYTQYAYGLNDVDKKNFSASKNLDAKDIKNNDETISNIRINDYSPTSKFYNQTQAIRQYYSFHDVDVDRYYVNGDYTQVFLSAREIDEENISNTWMNQHIKYTHGYGLTLSRVDQVTTSGQPDSLIGNIPPESSIPEIQITNPAVYFGELTNNYVLVGTDEKEFDYPDGDSNQYTKYSGTAGIKMNFINRALFSVREQSLKLLVSSNISRDSKIVINRNITTRVKKIMPYLKYDKDPYLVTVDGNLYWIYDAYTVSSEYPYSEPYSASSATNYIRNSVKVVIDAYNGNTDYYIVDQNDPIAKTLQKIYPKLFKDVKNMPESLKAHLRYPNTMFDIQAQIYARYHMNDVSVFYQNEDLWSIANEIYGKEEQEMTPNYYILNLPGQKQAEFVNSIPYTPKSKKNMTSLLVARNDGDNYGELILYQFPKSKTVYGPMQVEALIDQNTEISKEFSLWSSAGTNYSRGNLFVIPIEDSILYVEPVYLEATNSSIPEVKRVIVVFGDKIAYKSTLAEALEEMFAGSSSSSDSDNQGDASNKEMSSSELIEAAVDAYNKAQSAMQSGNWAEYGKQLEKLEKYLKKLQK